MTRLPALAALLALAAAPGLASAQTQDCIAAGLLAIDSIERGTQRVSRDPRAPSDLLTLSVGVRNISPQQQSFTASFAYPGAQQNFVTGQSWTVAPGGRAYFAVANVLKPGPSDDTVRSTLRLSCR